MHFLNINQLTSEQILDIFELTDRLRLSKPEPLLEGRTMILFFPETSLRTRVSFEKGISDLGELILRFRRRRLTKKSTRAMSSAIWRTGGTGSLPGTLTSANWRRCLHTAQFL